MEGTSYSFRCPFHLRSQYSILQNHRPKESDASRFYPEKMGDWTKNSVDASIVKEQKWQREPVTQKAKTRMKNFFAWAFPSTFQYYKFEDKPYYGLTFCNRRKTAAIKHLQTFCGSPQSLRCLHRLRWSHRQFHRWNHQMWNCQHFCAQW